MDYSEWLPPWEQIKEDAAQSGFRDDGYGDISPSDWDCVARLVWRTIARERERCLRICRLNEHEGFATHLIETGEDA